MYANESAVPAKWRFLDANKLTLEQINTMIPAAQKKADETGDNFGKCLWEEREKIRETCEPVDGQWRAK